jgi:Ricin-type beta-trefoil lectin domain-like
MRPLATLTLAIAVAALAAFAGTARAQTCTSAPVEANIEPGLYSIRLQNGRSLDEDYGQWEPGTKVHGWDFHGGPNQLWAITKTADGGYMVRSAATAKALDITWRCHLETGCAAISWPSNAGASQVFRIRAVQGGHQLLLRSANKQLGLADGGTRNGNLAQLGEVGCGAHQLWKLDRLGRIAELKPPYDIKLGLVLNNYTPRRNQFDGSGERAFYRPNSSWLELKAFGQSLGRTSFDLPVQEIGPDRMWKVYVNDLAYNRSLARKLPASGRSGTLAFSLAFEEAGTEIISDCYNNFNCAAAGKPSFDLSAITLSILLTPRFDSARNTFSYDARTEFKANVSEQSICINNAFAFLCDLFFPDRASFIRAAVEEMANRRVNDASLRTPFELLLNSAAAGLRRMTVGSAGEVLFY